jgi:tRNA A37 threonylcarbamoyladenosine biosynthesis protein TsaE
MISLLQLLKEATGTPKAIILGGGAGSGKTYLVKNVLGDLKDGNFIPKGSSENFTYLNPDDIIEKTGSFFRGCYGSIQRYF